MKNPSSKCCSNECRIAYLNGVTRRDELTPFRRMYFHTKSKSRKTWKNGNITCEDIKQIWENQKGICPYSGLLMTLPDTSRKSICSPKSASIDRLDSSKPYDKDNCQIVCVSMNYAKNSFSDAQIREFIKELKEKQDAPAIS